jgi:hypothetical protein
MRAGSPAGYAIGEAVHCADTDFLEAAIWRQKRLSWPRFNFSISWEMQ